MAQKISALLLVFLLSAYGGMSPASAEEAAPPKGLSGEEIVQKSRDLIYRIQDQKNSVTLTLTEKDGSSKKIVASRSWRNYRGQGGFDSKTLLVTEFPPDSRGISFLIWDYSEQNKLDDLWLYLPALRIVRRISVRDQNDAFLGSDLTFGDMGQRRIDEDEHHLLKEEVSQGTPAYIVESVPKEKESLYSKKILWISKENWTVLKTDYYDRTGRLLKRQIIEWQKLNELHVWKKTEVTNIQNGHRTLFEVGDLHVNVGLQDSEFTERSLKVGPKN